MNYFIITLPKLSCFTPLTHAFSALSCILEVFPLVCIDLSEPMKALLKRACVNGMWAHAYRYRNVVFLFCNSIYLSTCQSLLPPILEDNVWWWGEKFSWFAASISNKLILISLHSFLINTVKYRFWLLYRKTVLYLW